ncbi:hypothetical protein PF008_g16655 [Phytophthora fragariae]|uniref:Uncharacterized protein n=1 Tax=Phytophthora fragariae TaxID=53985 RepID=A0A6G0RB12_9STRA|nr:hypothetical protein PF008_g16655 [Phytophthora fragariae]
MPLVNDESPHELVVKRALVLFKPFRAVLDLVTDPTSDAQWIDAFKQWEPTRSGFTREIMANMDDYCRAAMQDQECSGNTEPETDNEASSDSGEPTGMREDVEAVLDRVTSSKADPVVGGADAFGRLFDCDEGDGNSELELELHDGNTDASALAPTLPLFPNAESSVSSDAYRDLLGTAAHSTATMDADLRSRGATLEFPLDELQLLVNDTTNDESEPQRSQQYYNERPTEVVALIIDALEDVPAWSPLPPNAPRSPPPLRPYAPVQDVSRAYTLNERLDAAFALITTSLLRRFLRQELAGLQDNDGGCNRTAATWTHAFGMTSCCCSSADRGGGTGKSRVIDAVDAFCLSWHRDDSVVKAALTGKAATLIGGWTLASFLMRIQHAI